VSISRRTRLSPEESRSAALAAARKLLIEHGPQAVTLKAVAAEIGRTHANLLHHFGSAAGLQGELARSIAESVTASIADAVERARAGETDARVIVDQCFDAFGREGAGALAAWMIITGNRDALNPILDSIRGLVAQLSVGHDAHHVAGSTLSLVLSALGDSLLGPPIAQALGLPRDAARELTAQRLRHRLEAEQPRG
jgi:AcrR family transcriptional regulator